MKKINLHPEALRVESFATAKDQAGLAHAPEGADARGNGTSIKINCIPCTESPTCWCV
ncbi:MAG TPA: hypothetical protein VFJ16_10260 [Longimicrobium sp.]|nr:hypothetical protein [Longimicrobium sp.]